MSKLKEFIDRVIKVNDEQSVLYQTAALAKAQYEGSALVIQAEYAAMYKD